MTTITSTEAGATGRYIDLGTSPTGNVNVGAQTIIAYCKPTASGGGSFAYLLGKTTAGATTGLRFFIDHNSGSPYLTLGVDSSGYANNPQKRGTANEVSYNNWHHLEMTWDGGLAHSGIHLYIDGTESTYGMSGSTDGVGSINSDSAKNLFLMNRGNSGNLGREFVGSVAYIARWNRVLNSTERQSVRDNGPLSVPSGLILCWANQQDYSSNALTPAGRSTHVDGDTPPNTALGDTANYTLSADTGSYTITGANASLVATINYTLSAVAGAYTITGTDATLSLSAFTIDGNFERSSVNLSGSSVSGEGDNAVISIKPRVQESEVVGGTRWLFPLAKVSGVNGYRPTFKFLDYGSGKYHGYPWQSGRRPMFSYDYQTWTYFDTNVTINADNIEFRHSTAFTSSPVYISWGRVRTPSQIGTWISDLATTYPTLIHETASSTNYIADTFSSQTDELGNTIAAQNFYAFKISDSSLTPTDGNPKRTAVLVSGVHAGEDQGNWVLEWAVEFLLSADAKAQNVRKHFDVYVYPLINAPGRAGGGWRGSFTQGTGGIDDANRHFSDASPGLEIVTIPRAVMLTDLPDSVQVFIDFHGTYNNTRATFATTGVQAQTDFDTALEVYTGAGTVADEGEDNAGFTTVWAHNTLNTHYYITSETGDPSQFSDANMQTWAEAHIKALSDFIDSGDMPVAGLNASSGSYIITGNAATLTATGLDSITMSADTGTYTITGNSANLGISMTSMSGSYTLTGLAALFKLKHILDSGVYTITGSNATLINSGATGSVVITFTGVTDANGVTQFTSVTQPRIELTDAGGGTYNVTITTSVTPQDSINNNTILVDGAVP